MSRRRAGARVLGTLVVALLAALLPPERAGAAPNRPHDAPVTSSPRAAVPEVTPEYGSIEEAGIRLVFHPLARERTHALLARALAVRVELTAQLGRDVLGEVQIRIAAAPAQMAGLSPMEVPTGAAAVAFRDQRLVVMSLASPIAGEPPDLGDRLRHALAHLALDEAVAGHEVPRWFHEGYAVQVSGEDAAQRAETLCVAALHDRLLGLRDVAATFPDGGVPWGGAPSIAVAEAADFTRFLRERPGRDRFPSLIERLRGGAPFERALADAYETDVDRIERAWREEMARRYSFVPVFAGATLLWMVIAAGVILRRRRNDVRRRALGHPFAGAEARPLHDRAPPPSPPAEDDEPPPLPGMPPDPEVPQVEHRGRWYTLH